ncbi:hypothetical protein HQ576_02395 [bacterium]|nr:hypothetical protein [bacterium]
MPGPLLVVLLAGGCLLALGTVVYHLCKGGRGRVWTAFAILVILVGMGWSGANAVYVSSRYGNAAAIAVNACILFGLPSVPLAIVTAILAARERKRRRLQARRERAAASLRAFREKSGAAGSAANTGPPSSAPDGE